MNALVSAFQYRGKQLRTAGTLDKPLFVAKDVCEHLGIQNARDILAKTVDEDEKGVDTVYTLGGNQRLLCVTESGLYALIFQSRKAEAQKFRKWVTSEVLPSIRKTGMFQMAQRSIVLERFLLEAPATWQKEFGDDYFAAVMRLYGQRFNRKMGTPGFVGTFTRSYIYEPLLSGLTNELKARRSAAVDSDPETFSGLEKLHQFVRNEHKDLLRKQIIVVTTLAQNAHGIEEFEESFRRVFHNEDQLPLRLLNDIRKAAA